VKSQRIAEGAKMTRADQTSNDTHGNSHRARSRKGYALASARDRMRLRDRNGAERERLEKMLAATPLVDDRRTRTRNQDRNRTGNRIVELGGHLSGCAIGRSRRCPVCGDSRVVTDEVIHAGTLSMSECLHCEHRWTMRPETRWTELGARMNRRGRPQAATATATPTTAATTTATTTSNTA
jgi:hypothetical protein